MQRLQLQLVLRLAEGLLQLLLPLRLSLDIFADRLQPSRDCLRLAVLQEREGRQLQLRLLDLLVEVVHLLRKTLSPSLIPSGQDLQLLLDLDGPLRLLLHVASVLLQPLLHRLDSVLLPGEVRSCVPLLRRQEQDLGQALLPHLSVRLKRELSVPHSLLDILHLPFQQQLGLLHVLLRELLVGMFVDVGAMLSLVQDRPIAGLLLALAHLNRRRRLEAIVVEHQNHFSLDEFLGPLEFGQGRVRVEGSEDGVVHVRWAGEVSANGLTPKPQLFLSSSTKFLFGKVIQIGLKENVEIWFTEVNVFRMTLNFFFFFF